MRGAHLSARDVQAWADDELRGWKALQVRAHLASCEACRTKAERCRLEQALTGSLLGAMAGPIDTREAWDRLSVRSGFATERFDARGRRPGRWYAAGLATGAAAAVAALVLTGRVRGTEGLPGLDALPTPTATRQSDRVFVERLDQLIESGEAELIENRCCADRDGEGPADDGTVLIGMRRSPGRIVVMYEDRDGSGTLTPGDIVRLVSRGPMTDGWTEESEDRS